MVNKMNEFVNELNNLTNEELIAESKAGNTEALNTLFRVNSKLINMVANKYKNLGIEDDDLVSICHIALMNAYHKFDVNKCSKFTTLAVTAMRNEIVKTLRSGKMQKRTAVVLSLDEPINKKGDSGDKYTLEETLEDYTFNPEKMLDKKDDIIKLKYALNKLCERDRDILTMVYFKNMTFKKIGEEYGFSAPRSRQITLRAIKRLKAIFENELGCLVA